MTVIGDLYNNLKTLCKQWFYTKNEIDGFLGIIDGQLPDYRNYVLTPSTYNANLNSNITVNVKVTDLIGRPISYETFELVIKFRTVQEIHLFSESGEDGNCTFINVPMMEDGVVDFRCGTGHCQVNVTYDTGWVSGSTFMNTHMSSYDATHPHRIRRIGKVVHMEGIVKNDNSLGGDGSGTLISSTNGLPTQFRPPTHQYSLQQGSGSNKFLLHIYPNGQIYLERYGTTSFISVSSESWLHMNMTWFVD